MWQWSTDAKTWHDLEETETKRERRMFRIHRLSKACWVQYLRLMIFESLGGCPTLREVEFRDDPSAKIKFSDWVISVSSTDSSELPAGKGTFWENLFVKLLHQCEGWENGLIQQMWIGDFDKSFVSAEPQPLCAFFTGCAAPWCKRTREPWRGVQEVLKHRNLPMWGACGGAQAFAILEDTGVDKPWDCPRCRDSNNPKSPIYTHIGYTDNSKVPCGNFDKNICERGKFNMRKVAQDPAFDGLPEVFEIMEYHCGQIAYLPKGWIRVVTKGPGALTVNQCLRVEDRYIYAAQFHMELPGTPENSRRIMGNFLSLAKEWGGYNPRGKPVSPPELGVSR